MRYFLCIAAILCPSPLFAQAGYGDSFGTFGSGNGQFAFPVGISHDTFGGSLFVADSGNARIQWFSTAGQYQSQLGSYGTGNGQFINPRGVFRSPATGFNPAGIAVTNTGLIFVSDFSNHQIARFLAPAEWTANATHTFANLTLSDSLTLTSGKSLNIAGTMTMNTGTNLTVNGGSLTVGTLVVNGSAVQTGGSSAGTLIVGTLTVNGTFGSAVLFGATQTIDTLDVRAGGVATHGFGLAPNRLTGTGQVEIPVVQLFGNPVPFRVGAGNGTSTFGGTLTGSGPFEKVGTGTLTLSGTSWHTGTTSVNGGTLRVNGALDNTAVAVNSTGTLGGTGIINGTVAINSGGTLAPGASIGTLTMGSTTWAGGGGYQFEYNAAATAPIGGLDNDLARGLSGATLNLAGLSSGNRFNLFLTASGNPLTSEYRDYVFAQFDTITGATAGDVSNLFSVTGDFAGTPRVILSQNAGAPDLLTLSFVPVPEPTCGLFLAIAGIALLARRRLSQARSLEECDDPFPD